jgi:hypothetical protein
VTGGEPVPSRLGTEAREELFLKSRMGEVEVVVADKDPQVAGRSHEPAERVKDIDVGLRDSDESSDAGDHRLFGVQIELEPSELERIAHDEKVHRHAGTADLVREGFDELDEGL